MTRGVRWLMLVVCGVALAGCVGTTISARDLETLHAVRQSLPPLASELGFTFDPESADVFRSTVFVRVDESAGWNQAQHSYVLARVQTALMNAIRETDNADVKNVSVRISWNNSVGEVIDAATWTVSTDDLDKRERGIISGSELLYNHTKLTDVESHSEHITPQPDSTALIDNQVAELISAEILNLSSDAGSYGGKPVAVEVDCYALEPGQAASVLISYVVPANAQIPEYVEFMRFLDYIRVAVTVCEQKQLTPYLVVVMAHATEPIKKDTLRHGFAVRWPAAVDFTRGILSGAELMEAGAAYPPTNE